jgi:hypothetical protein
MRHFRYAPRGTERNGAILRLTDSLNDEIGNRDRDWHCWRFYRMRIGWNARIEIDIWNSKTVLRFRKRKPALDSRGTRTPLSATGFFSRAHHQPRKNHYDSARYR